MRFDSRLIGFGLFFITFGAVLLAGRQGWISTELLERAWQLWPLLLVGAGLSIVLQGRPGRELGGLVVAVTFGAIAGGLVGSGTGLPFVGCGGDADSGRPFARQDGTVAQGMRIEVDFRCGDLAVETGPGDTWSLEGSSDEGEVPEVDLADDELTLEPGTSGFIAVGGARETWQLTVPTEPRIELDLGVDAGAGTVDLDGARLSVLEASVNAGALRLDMRGIEEIGDLDVSVNAGSVVLWLPDRTFAGEASANAGSITFCTSENVGLRLLTGGAASSNDFGARGLIQVGEAWESPDFDTVAIRITLETSANAGSLTLNDPRTCSG